MGSGTDTIDNRILCTTQCDSVISRCSVCGRTRDFFCFFFLLFVEHSKCNKQQQQIAFVFYVNKSITSRYFISVHFLPKQTYNINIFCHSYGEVRQSMHCTPSLRQPTNSHCIANWIVCVVRTRVLSSVQLTYEYSLCFLSSSHIRIDWLIHCHCMAWHWWLSIRFIIQRMQNEYIDNATVLAMRVLRVCLFSVLRLLTVVCRNW